MKYPVPTFDAMTAPFVRRNGQATEGAHAVMVDQLSTHIIGLKRAQPQSMGGPLTSTIGVTYVLRVTQPHFTPSIRVRFLCTGRGTVSLIAGTVGGSSSTDSRVVEVGQGTSHDYADAQWVEVASLYSITHQDSTSLVQWAASVTDKGGGATLQVWQVETVPGVPLESAALP